MSHPCSTELEDGLLDRAPIAESQLSRALSA